MSLGAWWPVLAAGVGGGWCVLVAWRYPARLSELGLSADLVRRLKRTPMKQRVEMLAEQPGLWSSELAARLSQAGSSQERLAVAGEELGELEHEFVGRARQPMVCAWLSLALNLFCAFAGSLWGVRGPLIWLLVLAVASAAACFSAGRQAARRVEGLRKRAEAVIELLIEDVIDEPMPERRLMRWRRRGAR